MIIPLIMVQTNSCSQDDDNLPAAGAAVQFSATGIAATPATRTAINGTSGQTEWAQNDPVGIFMTGAATADNRQYTVSNVASGALVPYGAGNTLAFPQSGSVNFIAYYPWKNGQTLGNYPVDVSDQSAPANIDLLYSNDATGKDKSSNPVNLTFTHALAKLKMTVTAGDGFSNLSGLTAVEIQNTGTTAGFKLSNGTDFNITATGNITPRQASPYTYEAILIPGYYASGKVKFTVDGNDYFWDISAINFAPGTRYDYEVTVNKTGITVSSQSITAWGAGSTDEVTAVRTHIRDIPVAFITKGTFIMGSPTSEPNRYNDETQHEVTLTKDFYMSKYPVTNAQYAAFLNANTIGSDGRWASGTYPTEILIETSSGSYNWGLNWDSDNNKWVPVSGYDNHPVIYVTWYGASEYARWAGGSLPTEAQWEYACRGDYPDKATEVNTLPFGIDTGRKLTGDMANFWATYPYDLDYTPSGSSYYDATQSSLYKGGTTAVGSYPDANNYGLYDMHGNVYDWCEDSWNGSAAYGSGAVTDPVSPNPGSYRVLRGGYWRDFAQSCRSAYRISVNPVLASSDIGFRVVFVP
ncbi:SUMF1/EgtB/PvdO family nonheme iron enzyme [Viscerimonas tarda]